MPGSSFELSMMMLTHRSSDPSQGPSLEEAVNSWSTIQKQGFVVTMWLFFGIAMVSVLGRVVMRLRAWRRLGLDDYFLFAGAGCLTAGTVLLYKMVDQLYLFGAIQRDVSIISQVNSEELQDIIDHSAAKTMTIVALTWTTMFAVKFSFLAFFRQLVANVDRIQYYYWGIVVFTVVAWVFFVGQAFILCPYFGAESIKCFEPGRVQLIVGLTGFVTGLDCLSDILIVSIPIIILSRANIKLTQKLTLGAFLCLSLFMAVVAITRASKIHGPHGIDISWEIFWMYMESAVAVIMGSLTAFRTLFLSSSSNQRRGRSNNAREEIDKGWLTNTFLRMRYRKNSGGSGKKGGYYGDLEQQDGLPQIPGATMTGLRTFIRRNNRTVGLTTHHASTMALSQMDTLAEEEGGYYQQPKGTVQVHVQRAWDIQGERRASPPHDNVNGSVVPSQWTAASGTTMSTGGTYSTVAFAVGPEYAYRPS